MVVIYTTTIYHVADIVWDAGKVVNPRGDPEPTPPFQITQIPFVLGVLSVVLDVTTSIT